MTTEQEARDMLVRMGFPSAAYASSGTLVELANLINNSKRFKVDVAYMPVPRCETCVHSRFTDPWDEKGSCEALSMWIDKGFGCVQWKEK